MNDNKNTIAIIGFGSALLLSAPGFAQVRTLSAATLSTTALSTATAPADDDTVKTAPPSAELQKSIRERMAAALPKWDGTVLTPYETASPWEDNLDFTYLEKLLDETPFAWEGKSIPPPSADRLSDDSKAMRIRRADGDFRYHSRARVFTADLKGKAAPSPDLVSRRIGTLLSGLRFPLNEAGSPDVKVQEVALSDESGEVAERFPAYSYFLMERKIEGLPVEGSTVRAAVNLRGEVQRLKIAWPHFRIRPGAQMRSREWVLEEAVQKVFAQDPTDKLELASRLVYAESEKGDFLPAVQVDVSDGETPYRLTIPVAQ